MMSEISYKRSHSDSMIYIDDLNEKLIQLSFKSVCPFNSNSCSFYHALHAAADCLYDSSDRPDILMALNATKDDISPDREVTWVGFVQLIKENSALVFSHRADASKRMSDAISETLYVFDNLSLHPNTTKDLTSETPSRMQPRLLSNLQSSIELELSSKACQHEAGMARIKRPQLPVNDDDCVVYHPFFTPPELVKHKELAKVALRTCPLSSDIMERVSASLNSSSLSSAVVISKYNIQVLESSMSRLRNGNWLNDELINFYMCMLSANMSNRVWIATSFFMSKLLDESGYNYDNVKRWTRKFNLFDKESVFIPINVHNIHWVLIHVHVTAREIIYYDSLSSSSGYANRYLDAVWRYLNDELNDKKASFVLNLSDWKLLKGSCPQQTNGYDCGVFVCYFTNLLCYSLSLSLRDDINNFRLHMAHEILIGQIEYNDTNANTG